MNRVLFLSDKPVEEVKQRLAFMYGFTPAQVVTVGHVNQLTHEMVDEGTLVHLTQSPLTMAANAPVDRFLDVMARPPYNLHNPWLKQFDRVLVTYYDVSRNDRFIQTVI